MASSSQSQHTKRNELSTPTCTCRCHNSKMSREKFTTFIDALYWTLLQSVTNVQWPDIHQPLLTIEPLIVAQYRGKKSLSVVCCTRFFLLCVIEVL